MNFIFYFQTELLFYSHNILSILGYDLLTKDLSNSLEKQF